MKPKPYWFWSFDISALAATSVPFFSTMISWLLTDPAATSRS